MKPNEFQCGQCKGIFKEEWPEEQTLAEYEENFGKLPDEIKEDKVALCDDCYKKIMMAISQ